jgi:hypothetical protein
MKPNENHRSPLAPIAASLVIGCVPVFVGSLLASTDALFWGPEGLPLPLAFVFIALFPPAYATGLIAAIAVALISSAFAAWILLRNKNRYLFLFQPALNLGMMIALMMIIKATE